ncbi:hypothetical protein BGY98DRAFT_985102 [Russula aff. rugulosa BPL654]|nr:hypothetical protein BGY98DRAFT_985102 [Russula aff. rugulosa BPL654]
MRLGLIYFLAIFVLPSIARTHHQGISHRFMTFGDKGVMNTVISALQGANRRAEGAANSVSNALGEKLFGPTAESELRKAEPIAPSASHEPTTTGRRSKGPDGSVSSPFPFLSVAETAPAFTQANRI